MRAGAQTCVRSYYDVYSGREARPAALGLARRRAATERAKSDTKLIAQGCNTSSERIRAEHATARSDAVGRSGSAAVADLQPRGLHTVGGGCWTEDHQSEPFHGR